MNVRRASNTTGEFYETGVRGPDPKKNKIPTRTYKRGKATQGK